MGTAYGRDGPARDGIIAAPAAEPEFRNCRSTIGEQFFFEGGIDPGPSNYLRAVARPDLMFVGVNQRIERRGIDQSLFHEQRFQRFHTQRGIGRNQGMLVLVVGLLRVSKIMHGCGRRSGIRYEVASRRFHRRHLSAVRPS